MCNMLILVNDQGCQASCCRPFPRPSSPTAASGLAWLSPACFPPLPASTSCLQEGPALHCLWWCSGWQTIPGQWPWQTAACALLPAHLSLISSSQLVPLSFYSCCPGICWETQYCAAATGLLRPEVGSRVWHWHCRFYAGFLEMHCTDQCKLSIHYTLQHWCGAFPYISIHSTVQH